MSLIERIFYFHQEILKGKFPNSRQIAQHFEVSLPTAKRDIAYLRDRLLAPLSFDSTRNGFYYQNDSFCLPFAESPRIAFFLAMLGKMAKETGLSELQEVKQLEQRLTPMLGGDFGKVMTALEVQWIEIESISHQIFESVIESVISEKLLIIHYRSPGGQENVRPIAPIRIINYQGRWYLRGFCLLRDSERLFHIGRIQKAALTEESPPPEAIRENRSRAHTFGIFQGEIRYHAKILFTGTAAALIKNQHWHDEQKMQETEEGIVMHLPVSDDRELIMKILQYGSMAKVLGPPELTLRLEQEIGQMARNYGLEKSDPAPDIA
ncbi:helix-turn-helix transcriptional regulator [Desulforhopalus singaporensis]|uniref:Predicted DNA-binding transcriptional regulator YafY, contains an HTH and WYL domains n=1 Tax=Desulforhopalus singaporensis TaxID=91360 RepID=A0A1H0TTK3_9BACT|nr:WYL domain-containing protein [Desulforhopalus singaporensis]SDP57293.1 Predicted DNA-binding transcriptional regulator YafY, contains an HTH and WYL domains [Desulforhopalus singaporensis]